MTRDEIVKLARAAGFRAGYITLHAGDTLAFVAPISVTDCIPELERFAALVASAERAKLDKQEPVAWYLDIDGWGREYNGLPKMSNGRTGTPLYAKPVQPPKNGD